MDDRSERDGRHVQRPDDALQLASQMGNVAFTAYARNVARQPAAEHIEFPPDYIESGGGGQSVPEGGGQSQPEHIEFPPDYIEG